MNVKNTLSAVKNKLVSKYLEKNPSQTKTRSTDINILLNRVKLEEKKESNKKIIFSVAVLTCSLCFGALIF